MASWFDELSIRTRILLSALLMLLPLFVVVVWLLAASVEQAREAANDTVKLIAAETAANMQRVLDEAQGLLEQVARRPQVRALDPRECDTTTAGLRPLNPAYLRLDVRDDRGDVVCAFLPDRARSASSGEAPWIDDAQRSAGTGVGNVAVGAHAGERTVVLSLPIHGRDGVPVGRVAMALDLLALNRQMLAATPANALVTVVDRTRAVLLRSAQPEAYIGTRSPAGVADPSAARDGTFEFEGRDGVKRLFATTTLPLVGWKVFAGLPSAEVFADEKAAARQAIAIAVGALVLAVAVAVGMGAAIAGPISALRGTVARIAAGEERLRPEARGPPEVRALARQMNRMLDAKAASDAMVRGIFETAVDAIIVTNEDQVVVRANAAAANAFRCPLEQMIGAPLARFLPERHRERHRVDVAAFGAGADTARQMGRSREVMALRSDGLEFPIEASISHMIVNGQRLYTVIHRDVTERSLARRELAAGKSKLEAALASMTDAVLIVDREGRLQEFNAAFARFHRFANLASVVRTLAEYPAIVEMFGPDGEPAPLERWPASRALRGESSVGAEYRLRRRDSGESWIGSYSFAPVRSGDGAIDAAVVVCRDVSATKVAQSDAEASHAALRHLIANQDKIQDDERTRIARELHDDLQQTLAAIRIDLGELGERLARAAVDQTELLVELDELSGQAIVSTRRIVDNLRPQLVQDLGIVQALRALADQFAHHSGIVCTLDADDAAGEALAEAPATEACLFRVAQEALNNVAKHAQARHAELRLSLVSPARVAMSVTDDGRGIRSRDRGKAESFGILGMQERAVAHGGTLRIERLAAGGTLLEMLVPVGGADAMHDAVDPAAPYDDSSRAGLGDDPLPRRLALTADQALQSVIDAVAGSVAVLDSQGIVRFVNRGWVEFAERHGRPGARGMNRGSDYLEVCRTGALTEPSVRTVFAGLTDVVEGHRPSFDFDYPCHSAEELQWFRMNAARMADGDILVTHFLVAREAREHAEPAR